MILSHLILQIGLSLHNIILSGQQFRVTACNLNWRISQIFYFADSITK